MTGGMSHSTVTEMLLKCVKNVRKINTKFYATSVEVLRLTQVEQSVHNTFINTEITTTVHNILVGKLWVDNHGEMEIVNHTTGDNCNLKFIAYSYYSKDVPRKIYEVVRESTGTPRYVVQGTWDNHVDMPRVARVLLRCRWRGQTDIQNHRCLRLLEDCQKVSLLSDDRWDVSFDRDGDAVEGLGLGKPPFLGFFRHSVCVKNVRKINTKFYATSVEVLRLTQVEQSVHNTFINTEITTTVHNILVGKLWVDNHGEMEIVNHTTGDNCNLKFIAYSYYSKDVPRKIYEVVRESTGTPRYVVQGTWDNHVDMPRVASPGGDKMHNFTRRAIELNEPEEGVAPTDSRFRPDQRLMEEGNCRLYGSGG